MENPKIQQPFKKQFQSKVIYVIEYVSLYHIKNFFV